MPPNTASFDRPKGRNLRYLSRTAGFLKPYKARVAAAVAALLVTVLTGLAIGQGLKALIDGGFAAGDAAALDRALVFLLSLAVVMALGTFARFYFVSWIGERVVADLRQAVFDRILSLHTGFFETTRTGEVLSRLTTDTTLLQTVIGSSASIALRNVLNLVGGVVMLFVTDPKLTGMVLLVVPLVVAPIMIFGRRVRRLSRASQDRVADVGAFAEESINAMRTVQAFTHESEDRKRFAGEVDNAFRVAISRILMRGFLTSIVILLVFASVGFILWIGGRDLQAGEITASELTAFVFYATMVAFSVGVISEFMANCSAPPAPPSG